MYQAPVAERTEAWNPIGLRSAWIDALGSGTPRPLYVLMSGWSRARPGAMIADSWSAKRWNEPSGVGSEMTRGCAAVRSRGAVARTGRIALTSSVRGRNRVARTAV